MCPACIASTAFMIAGVISTGGLTALLAKKLGTKRGKNKSSQNTNPKEESWEK